MLDTAGLIRHYDDRPFLTPAGIRVEPLELSHDGPTFGFRVEVKPARARAPSPSVIWPTPVAGRPLSPTC